PNPLRGSSIRPRKLTAPCHSGRTRPAASPSTYTPFGITTASPPTCWPLLERAFSDPAIRASIFSSAGRSKPAAALIARDRTCQLWKVATNGPSPDHNVSSEALGVVGSCTWTTSHVPSCSQVRTRAAVRGPNVTRATDPLYGTPTARPAHTPYGGATASSTGASPET